MSQTIFWDPNLKYGNPVKCGKIHEGQRVKGAWFRGWNVRWSEGLTRVGQRVKSPWVREGETRVGQRVKCVWVKDAASFLHRSQNEA